MLHRIYLDHSATTPVDPEVKIAMEPYLTDCYGNPSSLHRFGREAKVAIEDAREKVADALDARPREIYFTSGGTESNNWALQGAVAALRSKGNHIVTSAIEHSSVLETCKHLETEGYRVSFVPPDKHGRISVEAVEGALTDDTILVSIMTANNEVGTINPIEQISEIVHKRGILLHTDAVQSFGHIMKSATDASVDLVSISAHKFYGPKGVGVLYVRSGSQLGRMFFGGGHERRMRAGTENVPAIVGMGKATELLQRRAVQDDRRVKTLRDKLSQKLAEVVDHVIVNGDLQNGLPGLLNCSFLGVEGESVVVSLDLKGIAVSSGSACAAGTMEPSHVLDAMGLDPEVAKSSVRFSLGRSNTDEDVETTVTALAEVVGRLRSLSSFR